jgi:adhesin transport system outer membrane protein
LGGGANPDFDRIISRVGNAESARIEAEGQFQTSLSEFSRLTRIVPSSLVIPRALIPAIPSTVDEAQERALQSNPTYHAALAKVHLAERDRQKAYAALSPKLSIQYSDSYSYNAGGAALGNPVDGVYPTQKTQSLMLVAQWTLNGGTSVTEAMSAGAKIREMQFHAQDARATIEQAISSGYTARNAAQRRKDVLLKSVAANARVVSGFEEQYRDGGRSLFDLLDAYEQNYGAKLSLIRVEIAHAKASFQIRRLMGELANSIVGD